MTTTSGNATELGATLTNYVSGLTYSQFDYIPRSVAKGDNGSCNLCMSTIVTGDEIVNLHPCSHKFHTDCARSWFTQNSTMCPICGTDMVKAMGLPSQMYDPSRDNNVRNSIMAMPEVNHNYSYQQDSNNGLVGYPAVPDQAHHSAGPSRIL
ncbi:hypothetical protein GGI15_001126 [Coemansia interrupta]|uniref:RING-type domain-containing protein n=1 Tax=Coemansia interrupta TaxID=1126814 RepID=A0A9W8LLN9_9FUNG|nr:hypothetical protein GGI15_001126 [Coemansia interrupta]